MSDTDARLDRIEAYMRGNRMDASFDRLDGILDRINTHLQIILDHLAGTRLLKGPPMSEQRHDHIKALTQQIAARGRWRPPTWKPPSPTCRCTSAASASWTRTRHERPTRPIRLPRRCPATPLKLAPRCAAHADTGRPLLGLQGHAVVVVRQAGMGLHELPASSGSGWHAAPMAAARMTPA